MENNQMALSKRARSTPAPNETVCASIAAARAPHTPPSSLRVKPSLKFYSLATSECEHKKPKENVYLYDGVRACRVPPTAPRGRRQHPTACSQQSHKFVHQPPAQACYRRRAVWRLWRCKMNARSQEPQTAMAPEVSPRTAPGYARRWPRPQRPEPRGPESAEGPDGPPQPARPGARCRIHIQPQRCRTRDTSVALCATAPPLALLPRLGEGGIGGSQGDLAGWGGNCMLRYPPFVPPAGSLCRADGDDPCRHRRRHLLTPWLTRQPVPHAQVGDLGQGLGSRLGALGPHLALDTVLASAHEHQRAGAGHVGAFEQRHRALRLNEGVGLGVDAEQRGHCHAVDGRVLAEGHEGLGWQAPHAPPEGPEGGRQKQPIIRHLFTHPNGLAGWG
eukprot:scaffold16449_cov114-Isochrysis_galbana.AAC.2